MCKQFWAATFLCDALVMCLLLASVCAANDDHTQRHEEYEERLLFVGEYGTGINQLRQYVPEEDPEVLHPPCMAVAPDGTVLIADQFNGFIKRFSVNGEVIQTIPVDTSLPGIAWLSVDVSGDIHYLREDSWLESYNSKGEHLASVSLAESEFLLAYNMKLSEGNIYIRDWDRELMDYVGLRFNSRGGIEERRTEHPLLWVATAGRYTVVEITEHSYRFCGETMGMAKGETFQKDEDGDLHFSNCLGVDKNNNLYLVERRDLQTHFVKYDCLGREVAEIQVLDECLPWDGLRYDLVWLDPDGAIYALMVLDDYYHWAVYKYSPIPASHE